MDRRQFHRTLAGMAAAALAGRSGLAAVKDTDKPNILWLIAEDCGPELGCYGDTVARTPRIDALAREGMRFENAFCTGPVCSPSRSALFTGMYATSIDAQHHRSHRNDGYRLPEGVRLMTDGLRDAGYFSCNATYVKRDSLVPGKTDFNFTAEKPFDGVDWRERPEGKPFFAAVNFSEAHRGGSYKEVTKMADRTDPATVKVPPYYPDEPAVRQDIADYYDVMRMLDEKVGQVLDRLAADGLAENTIVFFFGDNGRCWVRGKQWLYEGGIREALILRVPERFRSLVDGLSKRAMPVGNARVMARPEAPSVGACTAYHPGGTCAALTSYIDLPVTTLLLAGAALPPRFDGRCLFGGAASDYVIAARDRCDETVDRIRCVRTPRYKYIRNFMPERPYLQPNRYIEANYPVLQVLKDGAAAGTLKGAEAIMTQSTRPAEELYDLQSDPDEIHNIADDHEHQEELMRLRRTLDEWIKATDDKGAYPEKASAVSK